METALLAPDTRLAELIEEHGDVSAPEKYDVTSLGEGLKLLDSKPFRLNKKTAGELLSLATFVGERPVRDRHVEALMGAMRRGTFLPELVQLATCSLSGTDHRINGQHTCWAVYNLDTDVEYTVRLFRYRAETDADLRRLYGSFDRNAPRTAANVLLSYLVGTPEFSDFSGKTIRLLSEGLAVWLWGKGHERAKHDSDDRAYLMQRDYLSLVKKVGDYLSGIDLWKSAKHLRRSSVTAAMFATFRVPQKDKPAVEFWSRVADGLELTSKDDPRYRLREFLKESVLKTSSHGSSSKNRIVGTEYMYRACIYCWNAWRRGELQRQLTVPASSHRPKVA